MADNNGNGKRRLKARHWTYLGICALIASTAAAWQGTRFLWAQTAEPYICTTAKKIVSDSIKPINEKYCRVLFTTQKTQTYIETIMNEETRAVAESRWRRDSLLMRAAIDGGR